LASANGIVLDGDVSFEQYIRNASSFELKFKKSTKIIIENVSLATVMDGNKYLKKLFPIRQ
jgi:hypothetical protein